MSGLNVSIPGFLKVGYFFFWHDCLRRRRPVAERAVGAYRVVVSGMNTMKLKLSIIIILFCSCAIVRGQTERKWSWDLIQPSVSNCEDVVKLLEIEECDYPTTIISTDEAQIVIGFFKNKKVQKITIILSKTIRLSDYVRDASDYESEDTDVLEMKILTNPGKGIKLGVQEIGGEYIISTINKFVPRNVEDCKQVNT